MTGLVTQSHPTFLPRIDGEAFLSSISFVINGERVRAPSWDLAPTWEGEDVEIGKTYGDLLRTSFNVETLSELAEKDPDGLMHLWNSDNLDTTDPFNKPRLTEARDSWIAHLKKEGASIPLCASLKNVESDMMFERFQSRQKGASQRARNKAIKVVEKSKSESEIEVEKPKSKAQKRKREVEEEEEEEEPKRKKVKKSKREVEVEKPKRKKGPKKVKKESAEGVY
jgi:hypothetical protein